MSVRTVSTTSAVRQSVSEQEWQTRVELAASHRLMAHFGVHDLTHNHLPARVPDATGPERLQPAARSVKPAGRRRVAACYTFRCQARRRP